MEKMESNPSSLVSRCQPIPLIYLKQTFNIAQLFCFDVQPENISHNQNYLKKTIHFPTSTSQTISTFQDITFCSGTHMAFLDASYKAFPKLFPIIARMKSLRRFKASFVDFYQENTYFSTFFDYVFHLSSLTSLDINLEFSEYIMDWDLSPKIAKCLKSCVKLQNLSYTSHPLTSDENAISIAKSLRHLLSLKSLIFEITSASSISSDEPIKEFSEALACLFHLQNLTLKMNYWLGDGNTKEGFYISRALKSLKNLEVLKLELFDRCSIEDYPELLISIGDLSKLSHFSWNSLTKMSVNSFIAFSRALQNLNLLSKLDMMIDSSSIDGFENIPKSLVKLTNLVTFEFSCYHIDNLNGYHLQDFAIAIGKMKNLAELCFHFYEGDGLDKFCQSIGLLTSLKVLGLEFCKSYNFDVQIYALQKLKHSIKNLLQLKHFIFNVPYSSIFEEATACEIVSLLENMKNLEILSLHFFSASRLSKNFFTKFYEVAACSSLKKFYFTCMDSDHNDDDFAIFPNLIQKFTLLNEISIYYSNNDKISDLSVENVIKSIANLQEITKINLSFVQCNISENLYMIFDEQFETKEKLESANIRFSAPINQQSRNIQTKYEILKLKKKFNVDCL